MPTMTQAVGLSHAQEAGRNNLRSLVILLRALVNGDVSFDNLLTVLLVVTGATHLRGLLYRYTPAPTTAIATATLTAAQMIGGIIVATPTTTATYTTLTGTLLEAALSADIATDDGFDLTIINKGGAGDIITMAGGTGVTFEGSVTIDDAGADINSSGTFRFRRSAANTFIAYRMN